MTKGYLFAAMCLASLPFCLPALAADPPVKALAERLKRKELVLRTHEAALGQMTGGLATIRNWQVWLTMQEGKVAVNKTTDWDGQYFVSRDVYQVRDVAFDKNQDTLEITLRTVRSFRGERDGKQIQVRIPSASQLTPEGFDRFVYSLFFKDGEDVEVFTSENYARLARLYLDPHPEFSSLSPRQEMDMLVAIDRLCLCGRPEFEKVNEGLFFQVTLRPDLSDFNDLRVNKNQRLASTIENRIGALKEKAKIVPASLADVKPLGIRFSWGVWHRDFSQTTMSKTEKVDLFVPVGVLSGLTKGDVSAFEMVQGSVLRADGTKVTLNAYEPVQ